MGYAITVVSVWYEFRPLGYPYHNIWICGTGGFGFIIWAGGMWII